MNEKKKKAPVRFNFNLLDVVIILLVLLCIVGVWQRKNLQNLFKSGNAYDAYTVTFEAKTIRGDTAALLTDGAAVYLLDDKGTKISFGTLNGNVTSVAAATYVLDGSGNSIAVTYPEDAENRRDITGTLACRGVQKGNQFLLQGKFHLAANQTVTIHTETADLEICITGITKNA